MEQLNSVKNSNAYYTSGNYELMNQLPHINMPIQFADYIGSMICQVLEERRGVEQLKTYAPDYIIKKIVEISKYNQLNYVIRRPISLTSKIHFESRCKAFVFINIQFQDSGNDTYIIDFVQRDKSWMIYEFESFNEIIKKQLNDNGVDYSKFKLIPTVTIGTSELV